VKLATKMPSWAIECYGDMEDYLDEQIYKLQTDYIDYYLVHALNQAYWDNVLDCDLFAFLDKAKEDKKIRFAGFSFHDELPLFKEIVDAYPWDFVQVQYNFMDEEFQAGREGIEYAAAKGMGVVVMEPLRGGSLVKNVPPRIMDVWNSAGIDRSPAEWALRYIWNHPDVSTVLSGMGTFAEIDENIKAAGDALPDSLSESELGVIRKVRDAYKNSIAVPCTACNYCMPCPFGVDIPGCFKYLNNGAMFDEYARANGHYNLEMPTAGRAGKCTQCGECEPKCPQQIAIIDDLKTVAETFGS